MDNSTLNNYWSSSPFPHPMDWPKWVYHATEPAKRVNSPEELNALGEGWGTAYIKKDYPKTKFKLKVKPEPGQPHYETKVVDTPEDEQKLEGGWSDTMPAEPKKDNPVHAASEDHSKAVAEEPERRRR